MAIGMTADEYWSQDPWLAADYRRAHELKRRMLNEQQYMQGLYNFIAFSTAFSNFHLDGKHHKANEYLKEPLQIFEKTKAEKEAEAEKERKKAIDFFNGLKARHDKEQARRSEK